MTLKARLVEYGLNCHNAGQGLDVERGRGRVSDPCAVMENKKDGEK